MKELEQYFADMARIRRENIIAAAAAAKALEKLVEACALHSGQSYKIRALLYSLWSGDKPVDLCEVFGLDHDLKVAFCAVILGFGYREFSYEHMQAAFEKRGLFKWFIAKGESES